MSWFTLFPPDSQPTEDDIASYIASPLWADLNNFLQSNYDIQPKYGYSSCSAQPGWNIKYQKAGRSLCTLYPMDGFFIALIVVGGRELPEVELLDSTFTPHVQGLRATSSGMAGAQWLMISVTDAAILKDVKALIQTRRKIKK